MILCREAEKQDMQQRDKFSEQLASMVSTVDRIDQTTRAFDEEYAKLIYSSNSDPIEMWGKRSELVDTLFESEWAPGDAEELDCSPAEQNRNGSLQGMVIDSLLFPVIEGRESSIPEAYEKAYEWIFDEAKVAKRAWMNFPRWLESSPECLYWVTGKPGAGKSTLMKFICGHHLLEKYLKN